MNEVDMIAMAMLWSAHVNETCASWREGLATCNPQMQWDRCLPEVRESWRKTARAWLAKLKS